MEPECKSITKVILPAIRASVAEVMFRRYNYNQEEIATKLGVVQVAVSKYLNSRFSRSTESVKRYIIKNRLNERVVQRIVKGGTRERIDSEIDKLCDRLLTFDLA